MQRFSRSYQRWFPLALFGGLLATGCPARLEGALDTLLAPAAGASALTLPYSDLLPIAAFLARWL